MEMLPVHKQIAEVAECAAFAVRINQYVVLLAGEHGSVVTTFRASRRESRLTQLNYEDAGTRENYAFAFDDGMTIDLKVDKLTFKICHCSVRCALSALVDGEWKQIGQPTVSSELVLDSLPALRQRLEELVIRDAPKPN